MKNPWDVLRGRELPVVVFWCYCVLGMALAIMFLGMFVMGAAKSDRAIVVAGILFLAYVVWAHVSLWTCASNARRRAWGYVARTYAGVMLAGIAVTLIRSYLFIGPPEIEVLLVR